jgi:glucan biosynthesis protein C
METAKLERRYDLDWLRVMAFTLLIFFHTGMMFNTWGWHIKNNVTSKIPELFMTLLHQWRMPLLFVISGAAASFLLRRLRVGTYMGNRLQRLLLPLVFGMLVIIPPQVYYERLFQGQTFASFADFYRTVLALVPYPAGNFSWHHLWYIPYIFVFSFLILPLSWYATTQRGKQQMMKALDFSAKKNTVILWFLPLAILQIMLRPFWPQDTNNLVADWANFAWAFTFFVYGFLLATHTAVWGTIENIRHTTLKIAVASFVVLAIIWTTDYELSALELVPYRLLKSLHAWCWILTILGFGRKYLNRNSSALRYANEAVYPFYILHQTIIVVIGYYLASWQVNPNIKYLIVAAGTVAGCWMLYEWVIRRNPLTRLLFGMKPEKTRKVQPAAEVDTLVEPGASC